MSGGVDSKAGQLVWPVWFNRVDLGFPQAKKPASTSHIYFNFTVIVWFKKYRETRQELDRKWRRLW